jgi:hypothetical protein
VFPGPKVAGARLFLWLAVSLYPFSVDAQGHARTLKGAGEAALAEALGRGWVPWGRSR